MKKHIVSLETKQKLSKIFKGRPRPDMRGDKNPAKKPGIGKKISEAKKGWHPTEEQRKHMSLAHIGKSSPKKGKKLSEETRKKISEAKRGKRFSEKHRKEMSKAIPKGEKHWNYKGGITPENRRIRESLEFRLWREAVFEKDNFTCQKCGQQGGYLHPHHIFNFATYIDKRFDITNGITLCKKCHREFHKKYGFTNNTKEQLEEFLGHKLN